MVTNMDADAQVPQLYVQEVDRAAAAAEDPHLLVRCCPGPPCQKDCKCDAPMAHLNSGPSGNHWATLIMIGDAAGVCSPHPL